MTKSLLIFILFFSSFVIAEELTAEQAFLKGNKLSREKPRDGEAVLKWHTYAAERGHATAQLYVGMEFERRGNRDKSLFWLKKAAVQNQGGATYRLGKLYLQSGNLLEAEKWLLESVNSNHLAYGPLGEVYKALGQPYKAIAVYEEGAEKLECISMVNLGKLKYEFRETKKDYEKESIATLKKSIKYGCFGVRKYLDENPELKNSVL